MVITTWNLNKGDRTRKLAQLGAESGDILVAQEIGKPANQPIDEVWIGDNPAQGLSVAVRDGIRIERDPSHDPHLKFALPVRIEGFERQIRVLAIWAKNEKGYVRNVTNILNHYADFITTGPTIICGDFNANPAFDRWNPRKDQFSGILEAMRNLGLVSAYHARHDIAHGEETDATYYQYHREAEPFHIDYAFIPESWIRRIQGVSVGSFAAFQGYSDHRPMTIELEID